MLQGLGDRVQRGLGEVGRLHTHVVFRPFVGEVIVGKLKSCSRWVGGNPREAQRTHACMGMRGFGG